MNNVNNNSTQRRVQVPRRPRRFQLQ